MQSIGWVAGAERREAPALCVCRGAMQSKSGASLRSASATLYSRCCGDLFSDASCADAAPSSAPDDSRGLAGRARRPLPPAPGSPPAPSPELTDEELGQRLQWWIGQHTYNRGVFDTDPALRPAWSRYHAPWQVHLYDPGGSPPLNAVWVPRRAAEFEAARRQVLAIM